MRCSQRWRNPPATAALPPAVVKAWLAKFPSAVQTRGTTLLAKLGPDPAQQRAHLDELAASLKDGDIRRGQAVFNSPKTACAACHAIGYLGGNFGPDLTRIGQVRTERDLLEAVVYPSASFVRSYEPMIVVTKTGGEQTGLLRRDAPGEVVLATAPNLEIRIARGELAEIRPGAMSLMPPGFDLMLSKQELADLIAFLKAAR